MSVIPVAKSTVTEIEVIAIASDVKVAVAQEIASEDDEGVDLAIASDHAVLEVVLVQAAAATVQDHVIAKGQKGRDQKIVIEAEEIERSRSRDHKQSRRPRSRSCPSRDRLKSRDRKRAKRSWSKDHDRSRRNRD